MSATADSDVETPEKDHEEGKNYERAELFCGGHFDYVDPEDSITIYQPQRPNDKLPDFFDHCLYGAGASVGVSNVHTKLQAKNNYTAFRGELLMSWQTFEVDQYFLELRVLSWLLPKLFAWKARKEGWPLPEGWQETVEWDWPEMQIIDPSKYYKAQQDALKVGGKDYSDIMGPDWETKMERLNEMIEKIRELGLPLSILETVSGSRIEAEDEEQTNENQEE
jgi:capsid protein